jgi:hypothetical protein
MTNWGATQAKAKFSEVLDQAETLGPQRIQRRKERFILLTEDQYLQHNQPVTTSGKPFVSAWDALKPSFDERFDVDFPRVRGKLRKIDLE